MIDIDVIKWMVGYAEGFEWVIGSGLEGVKCGERCKFFSTSEIEGTKKRLTTHLWNSIYYPLLLQRAIEGINKKYFREGSKIYPWCILTATTFYTVSNLRDKITETIDMDYDSIDQAKKEALKYIYEKETI